MIANNKCRSIAEKSWADTTSLQYKAMITDACIFNARRLDDYYHADTIDDTTNALFTLKMLADHHRFDTLKYKSMKKGGYFYAEGYNTCTKGPRNYR